MKRRDFIRHLEDNGCEFLREGSAHTIYVNRRTRKSSAVPRHRELNRFLVRKICRNLEIPTP
ncbi:MAG: type II toxin-antitoxin system HicA family toxin [Caldilineaceae bacterium SB0668_bin_21]|nr:type II toxin-antitoxin system HicA family toxin [Caldilineaceae bacterium SB0668_bin_21]MYC22950.1 type II toxin-antitoxin system HicA family toxin [Caldilineaceae bacterium SB0662_bin_25]